MEDKEMERNINEGMKVVNMKKVTFVHGLFIVAFAVLANMIQFIGAEKVGKDGASIYNVNSMAYYAGQVIFVVAVLAVNPPLLSALYVTLSVR